MSESLKSKTAKSVLWSAIERFSVQGIQFFLSIIIARLVLPSDYGMIAMVMIFLSIAQTLIDSGFSTVLIQKQDRNDEDYSTVFYFNLALGILLYIVLYWVAPFIASFYNLPVLTIVIRIIGLNLIFISLSIIYRAKLTIELDFRKQALISLISVLISGVLGIYFAYRGWGVWALVIQSLLNNFLNSFLLWMLTSHIMLNCFSMSSFRQLFGFGSKLLLAGLLNTIYMNLYTLVIGKRYDSIALGYYNRTSTIAQFPSNNLSNIINRALFPIFCQYQNDSQCLFSMYKKAIQLTTFCVFPLMAILLCYSDSLIFVLLGEKWIESSSILKILCLAYIANPVMILMVEIINVCGRSDLSLKGEYLKKLVSIILLLSTMPFGIKIMCFGLVVYSVFDFFIMFRLLKRVLPLVTMKEHLKLLFPVFCLCCCIILVSILINNIISLPIIQLFVGLIVSMILWILISSVCKFSEYIFIKETIVRYFCFLRK